MEYHINPKELLAATFYLETSLKLSEAHVKFVLLGSEIIRGVRNFDKIKKRAICKRDPILPLNDLVFRLALL